MRWSARSTAAVPISGHGVAVYVNVADLEATLAQVAAAGDEVVRARAEVGGDMGWWAEFRDPSGLRVGLCTGNPPS